MALFGITDANDEVSQYQLCRYVSNEAVWRIFSFPIHERNPTVVHLAVHLDNGQRVHFNVNNADNNIDQFLFDVCNRSIRPNISVCSNAAVLSVERIDEQISKTQTRKTCGWLSKCLSDGRFGPYLHSTPKLRRMLLSSFVVGQRSWSKIIPTLENRQWSCLQHLPRGVSKATIARLPPHNLQLKVGSVIIVLRNLNQPLLCNSTRLTVKRLIKGTILKGKHKGEDVLIPRIPLIQTDFLFKFKRLQFPVSVRSKFEISMFLTWPTIHCLL